jgi:hypothetical protein
MLVPRSWSLRGRGSVVVGRGSAVTAPESWARPNPNLPKIGASLFRLLDAISDRAIAEDVIDLGCEVPVARAIAPFNCDKIDQKSQPCSGKGDRTARTSSTRRSRKSSRCSYGLRQPIPHARPSRCWLNRQSASTRFAGRVRSLRRLAPNRHPAAWPDNRKGRSRPLAGRAPTDAT